MKQNKKQIIFNPEIVACCIEQNCHDLFFVFQIAKCFDRMNKNSGLIKKDNLLKLICRSLNVNLKSAYIKLKNGNNIFWEDHGNSLIKLNSLDFIILKLQPKITKSKPFIFDLNFLFDQGITWDTNTVKSFFVGILACRFTDFRPTSIETLMQVTGLSESTARRCLQKCPFINSLSNFQILEKNKFRERLEIKKTKFNCFTLIKKKDNRYLLLKQLPNTYYFNEDLRLHYSFRPKTLKKFDKINNVLFTKSFYKYELSTLNTALNIKRSNSVLWQKVAR